MPESYHPKRNKSYTLADAMKMNSIARIRCRYCKRVRHYPIEDLKTALGNVECDEVVHMMRCSNCRGLSTLDLHLLNPSAEERQKMTVRRVERVYYSRRVVWRDEGPE